MPKKVKSTNKKSSVKSKISKRAVPKSHITQTSSEVKVEKILVENFVSLQKVMTNLSVRFDKLANQISKLLELFEISAKALAEKEFVHGKEGKDDKKILEKIDNLLEQNKIIARGLTLLHEPVPKQEYSAPQRPMQMQKSPQPIPTKPERPKQSIDMGGYQKSISSENPESQKFKPLPKNY